MITNEQLEKFADNCVGRSGISIQNAFAETFPDEDFDELSIQQFMLLDSIVFACDKCGWLCSNDELSSYNGEELCEDCYDEETDDWEDDEE